MKKMFNEFKEGYSNGNTKARRKVGMIEDLKKKVMVSVVGLVLAIVLHTLLIGFILNTFFFLLEKVMVFYYTALGYGVHLGAIFIFVGIPNYIVALIRAGSKVESSDNALVSIGKFILRFRLYLITNLFMLTFGGLMLIALGFKYINNTCGVKEDIPHVEADVVFDPSVKKTKYNDMQIGTSTKLRRIK